MPGLGNGIIDIEEDLLRLLALLDSVWQALAAGLHHLIEPPLQVQRRWRPELLPRLSQIGGQRKIGASVEEALAIVD